MKTRRGAKRKLAKQRQPKDFDQILLDAIDEAFSSLGENVKKTIYFQLDDLFNIKKQEIPIRINAFVNALEQLFGLGARYLEIMFIQNIYSKIKITCKWPTYEWPLSKWIVQEVTFLEYVRLMRQEFKAANTHNMHRGAF